MLSADGRYVLTFNGEIYNFGELRKELERCGGVPPDGWRGHSDTEILLQAIVTWGLEAALSRSIGMFALGLWDREKRTLALARDRFGEKPLYYGWAGRDFVFASELKAIREHPDFRGEIDRQALREFAARIFIPVPLSIYRGIFKLPPGCVLEVTAQGAASPMECAPEEGSAAGLSLNRYWSYRDVVEAGLTNPIEDEGQALANLEQALLQAVGEQSFADVPVGAFLSGGIDSSTIVALCQKQSSVPVRTYTIGFAEAGFDEAKEARAVAKHLGTMHHEHYVSASEARDVIPQLPRLYDEPFADSSQIPTFLVSRFAREQVTVAMTGDGGDELFAGYNRHVVAPRLWNRIRKVPRSARALAGRSLGVVPAGLWSQFGSILPGHRQPHFGEKLQKAFRVAGTACSLDDVYRSFMDEWSVERSPVLESDGRTRGSSEPPDGPDVVRMMYRDTVSFLPDDILCKVDRASMAVSLETRVPLLDRRVAEVAARIPLHLKVRDGRGKYLVRKLLEKHVPRQLVDRPKTGFAVPIGDWLKGPLRDWAEDLLDPTAMRDEGWFDPEPIAARWRNHLSGQGNSTASLWAILMFQAWLREIRPPA